MIRLGLWVLRGRLRGEVALSLYRIEGTCYQHAINVGVYFDHLAEVVFVGLLHCKVILFHLPMLYSLEKSH